MKIRETRKGGLEECQSGRQRTRPGKSRRNSYYCKVEVDCASMNQEVLLKAPSNQESRGVLIDWLWYMVAKEAASILIRAGVGSMG